MAAYVKFEHAISALGPDQMSLSDVATGAVLGTATRPPFGPWTIKVDGLDEVTVPTNGTDRVDVMKALENQVYNKLGAKNALGHGYVTSWPVGLDELP